MRRATLTLLVCALWPALASTAAARTIVVDTTADELNDGTDCSLREAIEAANTDAAVDTCQAGDPGLDRIALPAGKFVLTGAAGDDANLTGDLDVSESLAIVGAGNGACGTVSSTCLDGGGIDRVLDVAGPPPVSVSLSDLIIQNGAAAGDGGAIRSDMASLAISGSLLSRNSATGAGGAIRQTAGSLAVSGSVFAGNVTSGAVGGGGVMASSGAALSFHGTGLRENQAGAGPGGAIHSQGSGSVSLSQSTVESNTAGSGGGISAEAVTAVSQSTFDRNRAGLLCDLGGNGGAIESLGPASALSIVNSTLAENGASCAGGAVSTADTAKPATLTHATVTSNSAMSTGGGVGADATPGRAAPVVFRGTVLGGNSVLGAVNNCGGDGARSSAGGNLETANSCGMGTGTADLLGVEPSLGPLRFNGGPTRTELPYSESPLVDAIASGCPATDQRGVARPIGRGCDIGAAEAGPAPLCAGLLVTINGTSGPDALTGTPGRDVIAGGAGADSIQGLGDKDVVCAGPDNDRVVGGPGGDRIHGEGGADKLFGGPGRDVLEGGPGKDKLRGGKGKDKQRQ